ncbi:hypothetical protein SAMD00019534_080540 [Acytostelium subglobosum LB1]|uniref:hypothetical protein n=1 Tax=Acytostelium subglobosum LB1 TaxID=1410327 RepID=UPI0006449B44|nr:hypothetical protein SAMD00019534_080540 [Acytostelium subglobosum LB1]GAM24879.1 hypothetical protein SAMD00019534_080540 [Acytostelium subglobosum LB1]|eukprot:XP_012751968.1 hypothetical protein SAMD00019534_080540 [Acytostelium subglobosum LB1]
MFVEVNVLTPATPSSKTDANVQAMMDPNAPYYVDGRDVVKWTSHRLFGANNIGRIEFTESDDYAFDSTFWSHVNVNDLMAKMSARSVVLAFNMVRSLTFSICHVPLTTLVLQLGQDDQMPNCTMLPCTLTELTIGGQFNSTLGALPDNLITLKLMVDIPIAPGTLPLRLRSIFFGGEFNQPIADGTFPPTLERVHFGGSFDQPLTSTNLPESVTDVTLINSYYRHPFSHRACVKLIMRRDTIFAPGIVFPNLTQLETLVSADVLIPSTFPALRSLDYHVWNYLEMDYSTLPHTLTELNTNVGRQITSFPHGLDHLYLRCSGSGFRLTNTTLPRSLRSLSLFAYKHPIEAELLPATLTSLTTINCKHVLDPRQIPPSIHTLSIRLQPVDTKHLAQVLATTSLFSIILSDRGSFYHELYRISDTLFLKYEHSILFRVTECAFIDIDSIIALYHKSKD